MLRSINSGMGLYARRKEEWSSKRVHYPYQIVSISFQKKTRKVTFEVRQSRSGDVHMFSARDIYYDDELLEQFGPRDIREIVYVAAWELFLEERNFLDKHCSSYSRLKQASLAIFRSRSMCTSSHHPGS